MTNHELERARAELKAIGADVALLASGDNITYVSHFEVPVEFGALATLAFTPPLAVIGVGDQSAAIVTPNFYESSVKQQSSGFEVVGYEPVNWFTPVNGRENALNLLRDTLKQFGLGQSPLKLAIEERSLPATALRLILDEFPNVQIIEASAALAAARAVKTGRELELLRFAAEVNKAGQAELRRQTREAGKNEFAMWAAVINAMEHKAGHPLMVFGELVTGSRCKMVNYPGGPKDVITKAGDLALMDMSPRVNGYWSDTTNTMVIGGVEPTDKQKKYGVAAREAFHAAAEMLRPGRQAKDAYFAAESTFEKHGLKIGHYAGHQIGVAVNEAPRLVPYDDTPIRAGMVFSIEPGAYEGPDGDTGARMEKSVIVHESGPEIICDFEWGF
ncbi:MAG: M24 family metallopeptidase [Chloroflexi bacterium]|nr:M24 family metallopeptidase [Chloroflexota bacterium]MCC6893866.1 aminopeptidase P family protein [Anaerolineae bacterium]